ncbi:MAG TPA: alpha glucosidase [Terricaulis sp.]|nr:alpha glucosidase [Terricaulis sp.]HRP11398.1 alpha glucosidase [Terricaulis sp.]
MTDWLRGGVVYQIYPRSFRDSNGDGVGDLKGIVEKLDYIAALGVDAIWISPFYRSPMKDYGYDVSDYADVDPMFGALADFDLLMHRAHALGLKVILDLVFSHSSDQHAWFQESRFSRDNAKADWYVWADAKPDGSPPNNWQAMFGGPSWTWDSRRRQYYLHNFLPEQPDLNIRNTHVQDALLDTVRFWLARGVDGFRLDVVNFLAHDAELRDNPPLARNKPPTRPHQMQRHLYDRTRPETFEFIARLRELLNEHNAVSIGEIEDEEPQKIQREYTSGPDRLHSAYSFFLLRAPEATPALFLEAMDGWDGAAGWPSWSLSNHDVIRCATRFAHNDPERVKQVLAILLCMRGTAFLYQGDELGLPHADVSYERLRDPEAIAFWPNGIGRDGARTPMPWTVTKPMVGFTVGDDAWLPVDPRHRAIAVDVQQADAHSVLAFTTALIALRKASAALRTGAYAALEAPAPLLAFERSAGDERVLCLFNLGPEPLRWTLPAPAKATRLALGQASASGQDAEFAGFSTLLVEI